MRDLVKGSDVRYFSQGSDPGKDQPRGPNHHRRYWLLPVAALVIAAVLTLSWLNHGRLLGAPIDVTPSIGSLPRVVSQVTRGLRGFVWQIWYSNQGIHPSNRPFFLWTLVFWATSAIVTARRPDRI